MLLKALRCPHCHRKISLLKLHGDRKTLLRAVNKRHSARCLRCDGVIRFILVEEQVIRVKALIENP